jgi:hypothetical protein
MNKLDKLRTFLETAIENGVLYAINTKGIVREIDIKSIHEKYDLLSPSIEDDEFDIFRYIDEDDGYDTDIEFINEDCISVCGCYIDELTFEDILYLSKETLLNYEIENSEYRISRLNKEIDEHLNRIKTLKSQL